MPIFSLFSESWSKPRKFCFVVFLCIFGMLLFAFCVQFVHAEEGITGSQLKCEFQTVQKVDQYGIFRTVNLIDENYGNFYVEQGEPGLSSIESNLVSATDDTLFYHTIAKMPVKANFFTKTTWDSFSTYYDGSDSKHPVGTCNWFQYRMYRIDASNRYYGMNPGSENQYIGSSTFGQWNLGDYVWGNTQNEINYANWKAGKTVAFNYKYLTIDQPANTIDHYKNVGIQLAFEPIRNITLTKEDNASISISYGIDNWNILSLAGGESETMPIGSYKTELVGYENNHISFDMSSDTEVQSVKTTVEEKTGFTMQKISAGSGVTFGPTTVVTHQNSQVQTVTNLRILPGNDSVINSPASYILPIELRPQINYWQQPIAVKWNVGGVDIRTKNEYWPIFNGDAGITSTINIDSRTFNRIGAVYAQNYAIQQEFIATVEFFSTVKLNGIQSDALLGLPGWSQGDVNWDMGITGETSKEVSVLNAYSLGTFLSDATAVIEYGQDFVVWIIWIVVAIVAIAIVVKFVLLRK